MLAVSLFLRAGCHQGGPFKFDGSKVKKPKAIVEQAQGERADGLPTAKDGSLLNSAPIRAKIIKKEDQKILVEKAKDQVKEDVKKT